MQMLFFKDRQTQGEWFHLTSVDSTMNGLVDRHTHDFAEVFWVTRGQCHHWINGQSIVLGPGALVLMRASDIHQMSPIDRSGFAFTNLAFRQDWLESLQARHDETLAAIYPEGALMPTSVHLSQRDLDGLCDDARRLGGDPHESFYLDRFLLELWARCLPHAQAAGDNELPSWLREALVRVTEPEIFSQGVSGFVRACNRGHEHVSRTCRAQLGKSPTTIVNEARLARASNDLRTTSLSVTEIAFECGFEDPANFYRLFKARFGTTPNRYRRGRAGRATVNEGK